MFWLSIMVCFLMLHLNFQLLIVLLSIECISFKAFVLHMCTQGSQARFDYILWFLSVMSSCNLLPTSFVSPFIKNGTRIEIFDSTFVDNLLDSHLCAVNSPFKSPFIVNDSLFDSLPFVSPCFDSPPTLYIHD